MQKMLHFFAPCKLWAVWALGLLVLAVGQAQPARQTLGLAMLPLAAPTPSDLAGKPLDIVKGTASQFFAGVFWRFYGTDSKAVTLAPLDPADPAGPLQRREVAAASLCQPHGPCALRALEAQARWAQREGQVPHTTLPDFLGLILPEALRSRDRWLVTVLK